MILIALMLTDVLGKVMLPVVMAVLRLLGVV
jgi:hypothetical protein